MNHIQELKHHYQINMIYKIGVIVGIFIFIYILYTNLRHNGKQNK